MKEKKTIDKKFPYNYYVFLSVFGGFLLITYLNAISAHLLFSEQLNKNLIIVVDKIWELISQPAIFISLLIVVTLSSNKDFLLEKFKVLEKAKVSKDGIEAIFTKNAESNLIRSNFVNATTNNSDENEISIVDNMSKEFQQFLYQINDKYLDIDTLSSNYKNAALVDIDYLELSESTRTAFELIAFSNGIKILRELFPCIGFIEYKSPDSKDEIQIKFKLKPEILTSIEKKLGYFD